MEKINKMINVNDDDHYQIKRIALEERITVKSLITKMLKNYIMNNVIENVIENYETK